VPQSRNESAAKRTLRRHNLSLRIRILSGVALAMAVGVALIYVLGSSSVSAGFDKLEQHDATVSVSRVHDALNQQLDSLDRTIVNWSSWDDTYAWIQDQNPQFVQSNLGDSALSQLGVNLLVFVDVNGKVVWAKTADLKSGAVSETMPDGLAAYETTNAKLLTHPDPAAPVSGLINLPGGPMMVDSRAILTSDGSGPSRGTMIVGRYLDADEVATLSGLTHLTFSVVAFSGGAIPATAPTDVKTIASRLTGTAQIAVPLNDQRIEGYGIILDLDGNPAVVLRVDMPRDIYAQGQQVLGMLLLVLPLLGAVIVVLVFLMIDRMVVRDLGKLTGVACNVAKGDITVIVPATHRRDEIGEVAGAFADIVAYLRDGAAAADRVSDGDLTRDVESFSDEDALSNALERMVESLRDLIGQVGTAAEQVYGVANGVSLSANELSQVTDQVAANVAGVSAGTKEQGEQFGVILESLVQLGDRVAEVRVGGQQIDARIGAAESALAEMVGAIEGATAAASDVEVVAASAAHAAADGAVAVRETISGMGRIRDVVQRAAVKVTELGAKGEQIGAIVETIDDIAEQTNLLALNAAIEAARAGEQGKGFAVVADEVRKLAERSSQATKEIAALIGQVQQDTEEAVAAMEAGAAEVSQGSELATSSGQVIDELGAAVAATRSAAEQIGGRIRTMVSASEGVVSAIREIDRIARDNGTSAEQMLAHASSVIGQLDAIESVTTATANHAEEVNAAAEEMNAQAQVLAGSADSLVMTSQGLSRSIAAFRMPETGRVASGAPSTVVQIGRRAA
jgi:methyl-accepting chemotaxis protein